jgi:hypothetical protein
MIVTENSRGAVPSGRKFVKLIKVKPHNLIGRLKLDAREFAKTPHRLPHCGLVLWVKLVCLYLVILLPQSVKASALLPVEKMPELVNLCTDSGLGAFVKVPHLAFGQSADLSTDKYAKSILGIQDAAMIGQTEANSPGNKTAQDSKEGGLNELAQVFTLLFLFLVSVWFGVWAMDKFQSWIFLRRLRPNTNPPSHKT